MPTITWKPWKPVDIKKTDPKTESEILNPAILYSKYWSLKKYKPNPQVNPNEPTALFQSSFKILWWHKVILTPDANNTTVFNKGTAKGFKGETPIGGHAVPKSATGFNLEWKKAQKKDKKKKISLTINKIIP